MKNKNGNMYDWITHVANPLSGECSHNCSYCYVKKLKHAKPVIKNKYTGLPEISEPGLKQISGKGKTIFIVDMADLFAKNVPDEIIRKIIEKCRQKPDNKYLFQTKNPQRVIEFLNYLPESSIICTTIETDKRNKYMGNAPNTFERALVMYEIGKHLTTYVTCEPLMKFDLHQITELIRMCQPEICNIGADSGNNNLPEPSKPEILALIKELEKFTIVKLKSNLKRLL